MADEANRDSGGLSDRERVNAEELEKARVRREAAVERTRESLRRRRRFTALIVAGVVLILACVLTFEPWLKPLLFRKVIMQENETAAIAALRTYCGAQNIFHRTDYDNDRLLEYCGPGQHGVKEHVSFTHLYSVEVDGTPIELIPKEFARAKYGAPGAKPYSGYYFIDLVKDTAGNPYNAVFSYGLCAFPAEYGRTGLHTFVVDVQGTVFQGECEGRHFTRFPSYEELGIDETQLRWIMEETPD